MKSLIKNCIQLFFLCFLSLPVLAATPQRIVSAGGSLTEWVVALGAQNSIVGVDTTSQHPAQLKQLPNVGYQRQLAAEGVLMLSPSLLLGTEEMGPAPVIQQIKASGIKVVQFSTEPSLQALHNNLMQLGTLLKQESHAQHAFLTFSQQLQKVTQASNHMSQQRHKPRVIMVLAAHNGQSLIAGKNTVADWMIEQAGGQNLFTHQGYKPVSNEALLSLDPQVILVSEREATPQQVEAILLKSLPILAQSSAVKNQRLLALDPTLLVGGLGPRLPSRLEQLVDEFYPEEK